MYCKNCGNNVDDHLTHCDVCGAELSTDDSLNSMISNSDILPTDAHDEGKALGIVSLILGVIGLVLSLSAGSCCTCCCLTYFLSGYGLIISTVISIISVILTVTSLILGIIANKKSKATGFKNAFATVGIILSLIALGICVLIFTLAIMAIVLYVLVTAGAIGTAFFASLPGIYSY